MTRKTGIKYIDEVVHLLNTLHIEYSAITINYYENMQELLEDQKYFEQFQKARDYFDSVFGWQVARFSPYVFFVKETKKQVVYIEVELKN